MLNSLSQAPKYSVGDRVVNTNMSAWVDGKPAGRGAGVVVDVIDHNGLAASYLVKFDADGATLTWAQADLRVEPAVGTPATFCIGSDKYAYIVTKVTPKTVMAVRAVRVDGELVALEGHEPRKFSMRLEGVYRPANTSTGYLSVGTAVTYLDPSF